MQREIVILQEIQIGLPTSKIWIGPYSKVMSYPLGHNADAQRMFQKPKNKYQRIYCWDHAQPVYQSIYVVKLATSSARKSNNEFKIKLEIKIYYHKLKSYFNVVTSNKGFCFLTKSNTNWMVTKLNIEWNILITKIFIYAQTLNKINHLLSLHIPY